MKVSLITVCYQAEQTIAACIDSVLSQDYPDIEYIIIDGNSKDRTAEIVRSYGERIAVFVSEKDAGIYDAMNKGILRATGDLVGILNADDLYAYPGVISDVVHAIREKQADAVYGDLVYVDEKDTTRVKRYWKSGAYKDGSFRWGWMPPHPTFFVKRACYGQYGLFNTTFRISADYEMMLRLVHKNRVRVAYLPKVLIRMRLGGVSNASVQNRMLGNREDRRAWELNGLNPWFFTLYLKPLRKIRQFIFRS